MLVICMCISFCFPVYASEPIKEDFVSISEYEAVIKAEGAKYGLFTVANAYQSGLFINFVSWETTSISSLHNNPSNGWIRLTDNARVTSAYADFRTGITTGYTSNVSKAVIIKCN